MGIPEHEFEQFFVDHYDRLVRSLTVVIGDRELARDCVQEAFIKASTQWRKVRRYDDPAAWVRRVAINRSRDLHRSRARRLRREEAFQSGNDRHSLDETGVVEGAADLSELLAMLSPQQRAVAALFYVDDLRIIEIAELLGLSDGAVKFHLNQARAALRVVVEGRRDGSQVRRNA